MAGRATLKDIAEATGLSKTTVSFVLNGREMGIAEETRLKVLQTARELGYLRNATFHQRENVFRIAFIITDVMSQDINTTFYSGVRRYMEEMAAENKMQFFFHRINNKNEEQEELSFQNLAESGADLFLSNSDEIAIKLKKHNRPVILWQAGALPDILCIHCDDYEAGRLAALHALENGHRRVGFIFPNSSGRVVKSRYNGFKEAFTAGGGECPDSSFIKTSYVMEEVENAISNYLVDYAHKLPVSLFYCFADHYLFPALRAINTAGLNVPGDISLIGTDDLYWGRYNTPAFSTVHLKEKLFAEKMIEAIKHLLNSGEPYHLAVPVEFIPRETVKELKC